MRANAFAVRGVRSEYWSSRYTDNRLPSQHTAGSSNRSVVNLPKVQCIYDIFLAAILRLIYMQLSSSVREKVGYIHIGKVDDLLNG